MHIKHFIKKPILFGISGSLLLLIIYFTILSFANSFSHAIEQFISMWYWIILLVVGFGVQVGLYSFIKISIREKMTYATTQLTTTGSVSTGSMVACCVHHLSDILPILGLSGAAIFLTTYQTLFIVIGILSNLIGINLMLKIIQENNIKVKNKFLVSLLRLNMKKSVYYASGFSAIVFIITLMRSL